MSNSFADTDLFGADSPFTEFDKTDTVAGATIGPAGANDFVIRNTLTTAGLLVGGGTAVAGGALVTAALPAQMLTAAAVSGALIYAGDRQYKGLPINPFNKQVTLQPIEGEAIPDPA